MQLNVEIGCQWNHLRSDDHCTERTIRLDFFENVIRDRYHCGRFTLYQRRKNVDSVVVGFPMEQLRRVFAWRLTADWKELWSSLHRKLGTPVAE